MDFLDPKKKRAHKIRLYIGYLLIAIALSIGSFILLLEAYGYDLNRKTGSVVQNGMVFVDAHPEQATIFLNGEQEAKTRTRLVLPDGKYNIELRRDGYRPWARTFNLIGNTVERLDYPFLFPVKLIAKDVELYAKKPTFVTQSPDRKWLVVASPGSITNFEQTDLLDKNNAVKPFAVPTGVYSASKKINTLKIVEWSTDNRHFLARHDFDGGFEFVMIDQQQPSLSFNVNQTFKIPLSKVSLRDKKYDKLHLLDKAGGTLRIGDAKTKQLSVVAEKVNEYKSYGDDVLLYVSDTISQPKEADVRVIKGGSNFLVRRLPRAKSYLVDVSKYDDRWYVAVASTAEKRAFIYEQIFSQVKDGSPILPTPTAVLRLNASPEFLSFSKNTRFISLQAGSEFAVYDAEHDHQYRYDMKFKLAPGQQAEWMDGHRFLVVSNNVAQVFDYDGINHQQLGSAFMDMAFFDRDYDNFYSIGLSSVVKNQPSLTKTSMRIPAEQ